MSVVFGALLDLDEMRRDQVIPVLDGITGCCFLRLSERGVSLAFAEAGIVVETDGVLTVEEAVGDDSVRDVLGHAGIDLPTDGTGSVSALRKHMLAVDVSANEILDVRRQS